MIRKLVSLFCKAEEPEKPTYDEKVQELVDWLSSSKTHRINPEVFDKSFMANPYITRAFYRVLVDAVNELHARNKAIDEPAILKPDGG